MLNWLICWSSSFFKISSFKPHSFKSHFITFSSLGALCYYCYCYGPPVYLGISLLIGMISQSDLMSICKSYLLYILWFSVLTYLILSAMASSSSDTICILGILNSSSVLLLRWSIIWWVSMGMKRYFSCFDFDCLFPSPASLYMSRQSASISLSLSRIVRMSRFFRD